MSRVFLDRQSASSSVRWGLSYAQFHPPGAVPPRGVGALGRRGRRSDRAIGGRSECSPDTERPRFVKCLELYPPAASALLGTEGGLANDRLAEGGREAMT